MNAKEMFESLGYKYSRNYIKYYGDEVIEYYKTEGVKFVFLMKEHEFYVEYYEEPKHITVNELQAINKQCEELCWLEKEERAETNYEHYKDVILEDSGLTLALVGGKPCSCIDVNCSDCEFSTGHGCSEKMKEWLYSTYEKKTYKLTQLEYDLIGTYITYHSDRKFCDCRQLIELKDKGHFKNVDKNELIKDILENCEVVG